MTDTFKLGTRVSLLSSAPPADDFFMIVTDFPNAEGKYVLFYPFHGVLKICEAKVEEFLLESLPVNWIRGTEPKIGAVGYVNGIKAILVDSNWGEGSTKIFTLINVADGSTIRERADKFLHPDDVNGCLSLGQRVLIKGKQGVCYVVNHIGFGRYNVAVPSIDSKGKSPLEYVNKEDITVITPAFKPSPRFKEETGFGNIVYADSFDEGGPVPAVILSDKVSMYNDDIAQAVVATPDGKVSSRPVLVEGKDG